MEAKNESKVQDKQEYKSETRKIVRFMEADIDGNTPLRKGLMRIKGVGFVLSNAVCLTTKLDPRKKMDMLSQEELKALENAIRNPTFPSWMLNRRKDMESGNDKHVFGNELQLVKREDINILRRIRAYRGIRHETGQPVRGQRTRSSFRTNKTLGVSKKKQMAKAAASTAAAKPAAPAKK